MPTIPYFGKHALCVLCKIQNTKLICDACQSLVLAKSETISQKQKALDSVIAPFSFTGHVRFLIHELKFKQALYLTDFFVQAVLRIAPRTLPPNTCFVPIPLHAKRLKARGFNQVACLAKALAKHYQVPFTPHILKKLIHTSPQSELSLKARKHNLREAFHAEKHAYQHIILVDDLVTSGMTASFAAKALKRAGATHVALWCVAETPQYQ